MNHKPRTPSTVPPYKQLTLSLLEVFREVARSGSQNAAARKLGFAQPTVWEQMQALERLMGTKLLEVHGRCSRLTEDGERLLRLSMPILEQFGSLTDRFAEDRGVVRRQFRVGATPRCMQEDLPPCVVEFETRFPDVTLTIVECDDGDILRKVVDRELDVGVSPVDQTPETMRYVHAELAYETDIFLVTPLHHPLARKRTIVPEDIVGYPIVNGPGTFYGTRMRALEAAMLSSNAPRQVRAFYFSTIRTLVKLGFGVGIVAKRSDYPSDPELHERSLSKHAGRLPIFVITPRGYDDPLAVEFIRVVREILK